MSLIVRANDGGISSSVVKQRSSSTLNSSKTRAVSVRLTFATSAVVQMHSGGRFRGVASARRCARRSPRSGRSTISSRSRHFSSSTPCAASRRVWPPAAPGVVHPAFSGPRTARHSHSRPLRRARCSVPPPPSAPRCCGGATILQLHSPQPKSAVLAQ
ncbi:hypothetical protein BGW80DRAFT_309774 [Lactifluus volemus]|nr:hypothetical protein BGW80DRAFT_309774 [Lactifluus volemus]